ncbi:MAG: hypothetical protein ABWY64_21495 [Tardiphaga sp.]
MTKEEVVWMERFINNTTRQFDIEAHADQIALACERGDDPWEAAVALEEHTWSASGPRLAGVWDKLRNKGGSE